MTDVRAWFRRMRIQCTELIRKSVCPFVCLADQREKIKKGAQLKARMSEIKACSWLLLESIFFIFCRYIF